MKNNQSENKSTMNILNYYYNVECAEQSGLAAAVAWLRAIRIEDLLEQMKIIDYRRESAMKELETLTRSVEELIKSNRGGDYGIHGFIGERAQVFLSNAWSLINGSVKICELIDDNGMTDYLDKGVCIQQKACRANGWLGLDHVMRHREAYPEFVGKYHIPKDFYETYSRLASMSQQEAGRLRGHEWKLWIEIQKVKQAGITIEPMRLKYAEIQKNTIYDTIKNNRKQLESEANKQTEIAINAHKPTVKACIKTMVASSTIEGVLSGTAKVVEKRISGKKIRDFEKQDIKEVGIATAEGTLKGAIRGTVVYLTENYTPVPGIVAGGAVSVAFESGKIIKKYSGGEISEQECVKTILKSTLTVSTGMLGAKIGGEICPIPIVGEVVGGFVFSLIADKGVGFVSKLVDDSRENSVSQVA